MPDSLFNHDRAPEAKEIPDRVFDIANLSMMSKRRLSSLPLQKEMFPAMNIKAQLSRSDAGA